ncbi:MAG: type II secretion system protein GspM [Porticoccaceae bacterium]|nr:type II secretion system protein GspM [Porticoccaceae bacterium]MDG1474943.1 type II secretion system protein GspM [Porticoccaceae bacterium]
MNKAVAALQTKWALLQPREQQLLIIGVWLLLATFVFVMISPMFEKRAELNLRIGKVNQDIFWVKEQREIIERLANSCPTISVKADSERDLLTKLARRNQLRLELISDYNKGLLLEFSGSDSNRVMHLAYQIACSGYQIKSLDVDVSVTEGLLELKGSMEVLVAKH